MRRSWVFGRSDYDGAANVDGVAPHVDTAVQSFNVGDVQPGQLAPPQAAIGEHQDDDALIGSSLNG